MKDPDDFERDFAAWCDGQLPPERAAEVKTAVDASPELTERASLQRALDRRVKSALMSDPASADAVREMIARARAGRRPAGVVLGMSRGAFRAAAASFLLVGYGMWWFCIPPFECSHLQALERASHDPAGVPGSDADARAVRYGLPAQLDGAVAAPPAATVSLDFFWLHRKGARLDYVRPDGSAFHVAACDAEGMRPSIRRHAKRDGLDWWIADISGSHTVAFLHPSAEILYVVTGPAGDESVYAAAKALRASIR